MGACASSVIAQQDAVIRQQDQSLDQLSNSIRTLRGMGGQIHNELTLQSNLLDDMERGVDSTNAEMRSHNSRMKRLLKKSSNTPLYCVILLLIIILIVVLYFAIST